MTDIVTTPGKRIEVEIHPTAIVDPGAEFGEGVSVGPYAVIGSNVRMGDRTSIGSGVLVERDTTIGEECRIFARAVLGTDPQDLKYEGEEARLIVGDRSVVREFCTLNRGTKWSHETVVGSDCLLMAYTHVAHDCRLGDHVILANGVQMGGHVKIGDWAIIGGIVGIHQFVRIGAHSFIGGGSRIAQDVAPYCRAVGNPPKLYGLNGVGLERRGFSRETRGVLKEAYRYLFQSRHTLSQGIERARGELDMLPEVKHFLDFVESSERGVIS